MISLDRREFVVGLTAAVGALSLGGCARPDLAGTRSGLGELFGDKEAWVVLGEDYLASSGFTSEHALEALASRLRWSSKQGVDALGQQIVAALREDFADGVMMGPSGWGLSETELQIYAVLGAAQAETEAVS